MITQSLERLLEDNPFIAYTYSYPHKTAYRPFDLPLPLADLWKGENRQSLFLYFHVPFCEMRCGFCNLFTMVNDDVSLEQRYMQTLTTQVQRTRAALGDVKFVRMAVGGGTPTHLSCDDLNALFDLAEIEFGVDLLRTPISVETSPLTAEAHKLRLLRQRGVDRISIGVQSFDEGEVHAIGRAQKTVSVHQALRTIRVVGFPTLNIDLMYGLPAQTLDSWLATLRTALRYGPEELYLYPLYTRPLTGLGKRGLSLSHDIRLDCYRAARDLLLAAGYTQVTMRMFRAAHAPTQDGPVYCVQEDGMVGLGCGARSYTQTHHYSSEYGVSRQSVRAILTDYIAKAPEAFDFATYGIELSAEEQRRRYAIKSLLEADGLHFDAYRKRFGSAPWVDLPELYELIALDLAQDDGLSLRLTDSGLEHSDVIGPWLYSAQIEGRMEAYELR